MLCNLSNDACCKIMNLKLIKEERSHSNVKGSSLFSHYINFNLISVHKSKAFEPNKKKKRFSKCRANFPEPTHCAYSSHHIPPKSGPVTLPKILISSEIYV